MALRLLILLLIAAGLAAPSVARQTPTSRDLTALSIDGRYRAVVDTMRPVFGCDADGGGSSDNVQHTLAIVDVASNRLVGVFQGGMFDSDAAHDTRLFAAPRFAPDAHSIYFVARSTVCETGTWRDRPQVYRIGLDGMQPATRHAARFVADGRLIGIVRNGPRAGYLLVQRQGTGGGDPILLVAPDGNPVLTIPGSETTGKAAITPWLKANGWSSY